jgi:heavy metal translocating P-type ATPase
MPMQSARLTNTLLLAVAGLGLIGGATAWFAGSPDQAEWIWVGATVPVLVVVLAGMARALLRGDVGVDLIAVLSMTGALLLGEELAGVVIAMMVSGGGALEDFAQNRARRELTRLLARAPASANRYADGEIVQVPLADVRPGDRLLVRAGEIVPVDGVVTASTAVLDEAALTGEALPVRRPSGDRARSGTVNAGDPFDLVATASAEESTYAGIVRLVQAAQAEKAPFVRLADRYALLFVPLTLLVAGLAWLVSGDPVRALAVLVVATPCPLILAAPVAIVAGISRAARQGILVKDGGALETLARGKVLLFDKTGTLTTGQARLGASETDGSVPAEEVLRLAASLDQVSQHVIAEALVTAARDRGLPLAVPTDVREEPGSGIEGVVEGRRVSVGSFAWVSERAKSVPWASQALRRMSYEGAASVFVAIEGEMRGALLLSDAIRPDTPRALRRLREAGIAKTVMVTGDRAEVAEAIAAALGIDGVLAERTPEDKVDAVRAERREAVTLMVGDGINDAPALAAADVGIAMGARGSGASTAADVVLLVDRLDRLADALEIARRARGIALQSVLAGMGMSVAAMVVAAFGFLAPVAGALLQEGIDVAVILNALRALGSGGSRRATLPKVTSERMRLEHQELQDLLDRIRTMAERLDQQTSEGVWSELRELDRLLQEQLLPHERQEEADVYPLVADLLGGRDPMAALSRTHREIVHLVNVYRRLIADLPAQGADQALWSDLRRILFSLEAILRLHIDQEDEVYDIVGQPG